MYLNYLFKRNLFFISFLVVVLSSCSKKITNPRIEKLETQEAVLALNTQLNSLNLKLERRLMDVNELVKKVKDANEDASKSATEAKKLSEKLSNDPGNSKTASRADRAARRAAKDAKKAAKLNAELGDMNDEVKNYQDDLRETEKKLEEMKSKIKFIPNQQQD